MPFENWGRPFEIYFFLEKASKISFFSISSWPPRIINGRPLKCTTICFNLQTTVWGPMDHASQALKNLNFLSVPLCLVGYRWGRNVGDPTSLAHDNVFNISEAFSLGDRKSKEIHLESDRKNKEIHLESDGKNKEIHLESDRKSKEIHFEIPWRNCYKTYECLTLKFVYFSL